MMDRPLIINPEAEADLAEARSWYESKQEGLGDQFLQGVDDAFAGVRRSPEAYRVVYQDLRQAVVRRFPYHVLYRVDDDQITVVAVYHSRRDPRGWQRRA